MAYLVAIQLVPASSETLLGLWSWGHLSILTGSPR